MNKLSLLCVLLLATVCAAEIFFQEEFADGDGWEKRWVVSKHKKDGTAGDFSLATGKYFNDASADIGLKTNTDARFYQISVPLKKEFSNKGKDLIVQYSVKHQQHIDCGGAYLKLLPAGIDQDDFSGDSKYNIMFGPDICGSTRKVHVIFNHKGHNHLIKNPEIKAETDQWTHLYTLHIRSNQTYEVLIDGKSQRTGSLLEDWDFLPPKEIPDPAISKPEDWVDLKEIPDPAAAKPEGWDDIPQQIKDKDAKRPDDWDSELDGEWEAPLIDNPEYKGEWKAPSIPNPEYKGEWVHPKIPNPDYHEDTDIGLYDSHKYLGIEIWQVKAGTIFDNFLVTDNAETAKEWAVKSAQAQEGEKEAHKAEEAAKAAAAEKDLERAKAEAERQKKEREEKEGKKDDDADADPELGDIDNEDDEDEDHDEL